jgi:hypothetical protein
MIASAQRAPATVPIELQRGLVDLTFSEERRFGYTFPLCEQWDEIIRMGHLSCDVRITADAVGDRKVIR